MDQWAQSVPFGEAFPLTPPDTLSDCSTSEYPDMTSHGWTQASLPEDVWTTEPARSDHNTSVQPSGSEWQYHTHGHRLPITSQSMPALDVTTPCLTAPRGNVDLGLSPVLSHESQSSHTLNSFSDPDFSILPARLDLSFATEPGWNATGPVECQSQQQPMQGSMSGGYLVSAPTHGPYPPAMNAQHGPAAPQPPAHLMYQLGYASQAAHLIYPRPTITYPAVQRRPLLPRTDASFVPSQPVYGPQRVLRPQMPASHVSQSTGSSVSTAPGHIYGAPTQPSVRSQGPAPVEVLSAQRVPSGYPGPIQASNVPRPESVALPRPFGPVGHWADHGEDWNSLIHYDQDDEPFSPGSLSFSTGYAAPPPSVQVPTSMVSSGHVKPLAAKTEQDHVPSMLATSQSEAMGAAAAESEEGRHRNHPLYSEGPQADGLYHCPFKSDPTCQHRPTKLKCNYDKFVDSHLKPFRCKIETCSKQEFSSTACLLRHEREAHGMHGHGDRPHLCYYPGCERGMPGNGFPRRYNLFDHMKRVHDHKDEPGSLTGSPTMDNGSQSQRRTAGRKRKASGPNAGESVLQRQRSEHTPTQVSQPMHTAAQVTQSIVMPQVVYSQAINGTYTPPEHVPAQPQRRDSQHRQRQLYSQWANQREVIARQMDFVQSPDDEANLHQIAQNIEELRRLSQEARRG